MQIQDMRETMNERDDTLKEEFKGLGNNLVTMECSWLCRHSV